MFLSCVNHVCCRDFEKNQLITGTKFKMDGHVIPQLKVGVAVNS